MFNWKAVDDLTETDGMRELYLRTFLVKDPRKFRVEGFR